MPFSRWVALVHFVRSDVVVHVSHLLFFCFIDSVSFSRTESFVRRLSLMCFFSSFVLKKVWRWFLSVRWNSVMSLRVPLVFLDAALCKRCCVMWQLLCNFDARLSIVSYRSFFCSSSTMCLWRTGQVRCVWDKGALIEEWLLVMWQVRQLRPDTRKDMCICPKSCDTWTEKYKTNNNRSWTTWPDHLQLLRSRVSSLSSGHVQFWDDFKATQRQQKHSTKTRVVGLVFFLGNFACWVVRAPIPHHILLMSVVACVWIFLDSFRCERSSVM